MQMFAEALDVCMFDAEIAEILVTESKQVENTLESVQITKAMTQASLATLDGGATSLMAGGDVVVKNLQELQAKRVAHTDIMVFPCERPFRFGDN